MTTKRFTLVGLLWLAGSALTVGAQETVDLTKYPDYNPVLRPDPALGVHRQAAKKSRGVTAATLPDHWNNAETIYFPPVVNQQGGSCGSASRICYMFNWEMNALRGLDGSREENQYPSHFTWLLTGQHSGKEEMAEANGVPNVPTYGGRTYSSLFGYQVETDKDYGWMTGYDKWYQAMCNRISGSANMPRSVETEQGREDLKWWLYNHNGDDDFHAGGVAGIGVASGGMRLTKIESTPQNDEIGVTGKKYVKSWGPGVDHALTIVGYDDRIEFDLDGNGVYGEKDKDEVGAWIIVNSWGTTWSNGGFTYCPYKYGSPTSAATSYWKPEVYYARKNYRPLRTLKIRMAYNHRAKMQLSVGVSRNLQATEPETTVRMHHFRYAGNGDVPMLGRWADGKLHSEPMEFGYDLTDLAGSTDRRGPLKYFFIIETKAEDTGGSGHVYDLALMDYEYDPAGIEIPFDTVGSAGIAVPGGGQRTVLSMVMSGERFNAPLNLVYADGRLTWAAPQQGSGIAEKYYLYHNGVLIDSTLIGTESYALSGEPTGQYQVSAVYRFGGNVFESEMSNTALLPVAEVLPYTNRTLRMQRSGFGIPGVLKDKHTEATLEFQLRPAAIEDGLQAIGSQWGQFFMHGNEDGSITAGWNEAGGNSFTTESGQYRNAKWSHVAVVVRDNLMTLYVNGKSVGSVTGKGYSGLGGIDTLFIGAPEKGVYGLVDEVRIWNKARSVEQLQAWANKEIANPTSQDGLLAYYKMITDTVNGQVFVKDFAGSHDALVWGQVMRSVNSPVKNAATAAAFDAAEGPYYVGAPVKMTDASTGQVVGWQWTATGSATTTYSLSNPTIVFNQAGQQTVTLQVTDAQGETSTTQKTLLVEAAPAPVAAFSLAGGDVVAGQRISLINEQVADGVTYEWLTPGANVEVTRTLNAAVSYNAAGTYRITLRATSATGTTEMTKEVRVKAAAPQADFDVSPAVVVKGHDVFLHDKSRFAPTEWVWRLNSSNHEFVVNGQNSSVQPSEPGIYDVTLRATNSQGSNSKTLSGGLVVTNADSKNGLSFNRDAEQVIVSGLYTNTQVQRFTVEFWARPRTLLSRNLYVGADNGAFQIYCDASGKITVVVGNKSATSYTSVVKPHAWHHYAVTFDGGRITYFRDGVGVDFRTMSGVSTTQAWGSRLRIGGTNGPVNGILDEFRIWGTALSDPKVQQYCNSPITDADAARRGSDRLMLYYDFNQSEGDAIDASGNGFTGVRSGFGPDGDAWSPSEGVFCLNFKSKTKQNVTSTYLKNTSAPFKATSEQLVVGSDARRPLTDWLISGATVSEDGQATTQPHVYTEKSSAFCLETGADGLPDCNDAAAWQTVKLPAGSYRFSITPQGSVPTAGAYLIVSPSDTLPGADHLTQSLAYADMSGNHVDFVLPAEQTVSLGTLFRIGGTSSTCITNFSLERTSVQVVEANGQVNAIEQIAGAADEIGVASAAGGLDLTASGQKVRIYSTDGVQVWTKTVQGSCHVPLPRGLYIVNGHKVLVR